MSGILNQFDLNKFKQKISLCTEHCLSYTRKDDVNYSAIVLSIGIRYEYFISWYDLRHRGKLDEYSFTEILNAFISHHGIQINESERLNGVIRRSCGEKLYIVWEHIRRKEIKRSFRGGKTKIKGNIVNC